VFSKLSFRLNSGGVGPRCGFPGGKFGHILGTVTCGPGTGRALVGPSVNVRTGNVSHLRKKGTVSTPKPQLFSLAQIKKKVNDGDLFHHKTPINPPLLFWDLGGLNPRPRFSVPEFHFLVRFTSYLRGSLVTVFVFPFAKVRFTGGKLPTGEPTSSGGNPFITLL